MSTPPPTSIGHITIERFGHSWMAVIHRELHQPSVHRKSGFRTRAEAELYAGNWFARTINQAVGEDEWSPPFGEGQN